MSTSSLEYQLLVTSRVLQPQTGQAPSQNVLMSSQQLVLNYQHVTDDLEQAEDYQNDPAQTLAATVSQAIPFGSMPNARHVYIEAYPTPNTTYPNGFKPAFTLALNGGPASVPVSFFCVDTTTVPLTSITVTNPDLNNPINYRYILVGG